MDIKEKIKNPKLIIFDLDGTLVDSAEDITNALNHALIPYGFEPLAVEDTIKLVGEGLTRLVEKILGEKNAGIKDIVLERFIQYYSRHLTDFTRPYPGIKEVLQKLAKYKKAVISNKMESLSKTLLEQLGLLKFFDIVLGSDSTPEKKPSPAPVKKVVEIFKVNPVETVIVGDSDYDIQAGKRADVNTVAVTYGYRSKESLKDADFLIDNINQLLFVIGEETDVQERRKETRYVVPEIYRHYITFNIKDDTDAFINVSLLDFSRHGIKLKSEIPLKTDSTLGCSISVPASLKKEIGFKIKVKYCRAEDSKQEFIVGAEIVDIPDKLWFNVFEKVHNFIRDRMGKVF